MWYVLFDSGSFIKDYVTRNDLIGLRYNIIICVIVAVLVYYLASLYVIRSLEYIALSLVI